VIACCDEDGCDAAVALPGWYWNVAEITLLWNRMAIEALETRRSF
jgi:hypothetical protein